MQGPYSIKFSGTDAESGADLFCVDVAFTITPRTVPRGEEQQHLTLGTTLRPGRGGAVLGGAVLRDAMQELREAFEAANTPVHVQ